MRESENNEDSGICGGSTAQSWPENRRGNWRARANGWLSQSWLSWLSFFSPPAGIRFLLARLHSFWRLDGCRYGCAKSAGGASAWPLPELEGHAGNGNRRRSPAGRAGDFSDPAVSRAGIAQTTRHLRFFRAMHGNLKLPRFSWHWPGALPLSGKRWCIGVT
jgi:hypothetical protein